MNLPQQQLDLLTTRLFNHKPFLELLNQRVHNPLPASVSSIELDLLIEDISGLLEKLIQQKVKKEMSKFVEENNRVLQQMNHNLSREGIMEEKNQSFYDASFSDIHKLITEEKKKAFDGLTDAQFEMSLSVMQKYEDMSDKIKCIQQKIRGMEDKYQTGFKSLWNVLSMTQSAFFDHVKQHKQGRQKNGQSKKENTAKNQPFLKFWK